MLDTGPSTSFHVNFGEGTRDFRLGLGGVRGPGASGI